MNKAANPKDQNSFTAYDFMYLFIALLKKQNISTFNPYILLQFVTKCQKNEKYEELLTEIDTNKDTSAINITTLTKAIEQLKQNQLLCEADLNQQEIVHISKSISSNESITSKKDKYTKMAKLVDEYRKEEITERRNVIEQLYTQEEKSMDTAIEGLNKILVKRKIEKK